MLRAIFASFSLSLSIGYFVLPIQAQVISDETLDSQVNQVNDNQLVITGGEEAGKNLFHSFSEFSIPSNGTVYFDNNANIENIFSRITGGSISNINGLIKANGNASLFLLNPAGIIFGQNAQLDLGGSFFSTTAEAIMFADGTEFSAASNQTGALLTVNIPIGLQYGKSPGAIISNGIVTFNTSSGEPIELPVLSINPGNTIALIGGEVLLRSTRLETNAARTEIGSVSAQELVNLQPSNNGWIINYDNVNEFGQVELFDFSGIESGNGGTIQIRGKEIKISNSLIANLTSQDVDGGNTHLIATDLLEIDDSLILTQVGVEGLDFPTPIITSQGGNILFKGNRINFSNGSFVFSGTTSLGNGGNITIEAKDLVQILGKNEISTSFISTNTLGKGAGGKIDINTRNLSVQEGGQIQATSFAGGEAGTIKVNATESIAIAGTGVVPRFDENSQEIIGERVLQSGLFANTESGTGGEIDLTASLVLLEDRGIISATANNGDGGNIDIATETLVLFEPSNISADAEKGRGGNININTQGLFVGDEVDRQITASSQLGIDGVVNINTPDVDSQVNNIVVERSPLATKDLIHTGCSLNKDYIRNQFNYIGRGGIPFNPLESIITEDIIVDLGHTEASAKKSKIDWSSDAVTLKLKQEIREATDWVVNQKGNVELTASTPKDISTSVCHIIE